MPFFNKCKVTTVLLQAGFDFGNGRQFQLVSSRNGVASLFKHSNVKQKGIFAYRVDNMKELPKLPAPAKPSSKKQSCSK